MRNFCNSLLLLCFVVISSSAAAFTREQATGIAETRFRLALAYVDRFASGCLSLSQDCPLTSREQIVLSGIWRERLSERLQSKLEFRAESADPGFFQLDGAVRIAKTGDQPGDAIFINRDMLAVPADTGFRSLTFDEAMTVIVHELGHHHDRQVAPRASHEELDVLGNKIRSLMLQFAEIRMLPREQWSALAAGESIAVEHFVAPGSPNQQREQSFLFVSGPFGVVDLTHVAASGLSCPKSYYRDELDFEGRPFEYYLRRADFQFQKIATTAMRVSGSIGEAAVLCINSIANSSTQMQTFSGYRDGVFALNLEVSEMGAISVNLSTLRFSMTTPPDEHWN
jgi:hypothetical protein